MIGKIIETVVEKTTEEVAQLPTLPIRASAAAIRGLEKGVDKATRDGDQ